MIWNNSLNKKYQKIPGFAFQSVVPSLPCVTELFVIDRINQSAEFSFITALSPLNYRAQWPWIFPLSFAP